MALFTIDTSSPQNDRCFLSLIRASGSQRRLTRFDGFKNSLFWSVLGRVYFERGAALT